MTSEPDFFRQAPNERVEAALGMIPQLERPKLYQEHNGRGHRFARLRYLRRDDEGRAHPRSIYLGRVSEEQMSLLQQSILDVRSARDRAHVQGGQPHERVAVLVTSRGVALTLARSMAAKCGYRLVGFKLRKVRTT